MAQYQRRRITKATVDGVSTVNIVGSNRKGKLMAINPVTNTITVGTLEFRQGGVGAALAGTFVAGAGIITSVVITNGGTGYSETNAPLIDGDVGGADAILIPTITNGVITAITIENGGTGYTTGSLVITAVEGRLVYEVGVSDQPHRDLSLIFDRGLYLEDNGITGDYVANLIID
jgi:hypothetical protein